MAMIIQQQKYQVKWLDGLQPPQSIDVIQTEKEFDEGDINKDEGITFLKFIKPYVNKIGENCLCEK